MPGPKDNLPNFTQGQQLNADQLQQVVDAVRALIPGGPGQFVSGAFTVQRPVNAPISVYDVAITESIAAATWDKTTKKRKATSVESPLWTQATDGTTDTFATALKVKYVSKFATAITVSAGKFRIGLVIDDVLFNVDCTELDMPS